jgi:hypothetical protein
VANGIFLIPVFAHFSQPVTQQGFTSKEKKPEMGRWTEKRRKWVSKRHRMELRSIFRRLSVEHIQNKIGNGTEAPIKIIYDIDPFSCLHFVLTEFTHFIPSIDHLKSILVLRLQPVHLGFEIRDVEFSGGHVAVLIDDGFDLVSHVVQDL